MRPSWIKIIAVLAVIWAVIGGVMAWVNVHKQTPEKVVAFARENKLDGRPEAERAVIIAQVAEQVNKLEHEQKQEMNRTRKMERFWKSLTAAEQGRYLDLVLPTGFKQMMEHFNDLDPTKRRRMVEKAIRELREHADDERMQEVDPQMISKIVEQGLKTFYSEATIEAKLDALPFLNELEQTVKWGR